MSQIPPIGYCTNVHGGQTWADMRGSLERHACAVRAALCGDRALGLGLWFSARSAREIVAAGAAAEVRSWLADRGLFALTFNGFPYGDFHQKVVKRHVYTPSWADRARLEYTLDLIEIAAGLVEEGQATSISTVPLGWGDIDRDTAARQLLEIAERLEVHERRTGRLIHLDLEPEPGCVLQRSGDAIGFFEGHLLAGDDRDRARRHLRLCHDVCHQAVMFEDPQQCLRDYADAGIAVGKVQISSGLRLPFDEWDDHRRASALAQLRGFQEQRYMHQTVVRQDGGGLRLFEDLPQALDAVGDGPPRGEWRVHFHVPIFHAAIGDVLTTRDAIAPTLQALPPDDGRQYEVETYAWNVLPEPVADDDLAGGIAEELRWAMSTALEAWS